MLLFDIKKQLIYEKKLCREDREIYQSMKQYLKYLSVNEIINPTTYINGLTTLFKCNLNLIQGNFDKARENLGEFKSKFYDGDKEKIF